MWAKLSQEIVKTERDYVMDMDLVVEVMSSKTGLIGLDIHNPLETQELHIGDRFC